MLNIQNLIDTILKETYKNIDLNSVILDDKERDKLISETYEKYEAINKILGRAKISKSKKRKIMDEIKEYFLYLTMNEEHLHDFCTFTAGAGEKNPDIDILVERFNKKYEVLEGRETPFKLFDDFGRLETALKFAAIFNYLKENNFQINSDCACKMFTALIWGNIQIGKSEMVIALINIAPYFFKTVIVFAGNTNRVRDQLQGRIEERVFGYNTKQSKILYPILTNKNIEVVTDDLNLSNSKNIRYIYNPITTRESDNLNCDKDLKPGDSDKVHVFILKKEIKTLNSARKWIDEHMNISEKDYPVLIIDDENDQASIDNKKERLKKNNQKSETIDAKIFEIAEKFPESAYIGLTATPLGVIFGNGAKDEKSIYPSFIACIEPGPYYLSPYQFFKITHYGDYKEEAEKIITYPFVSVFNTPEYQKSHFPNPAFENFFDTCSKAMQTKSRKKDNQTKKKKDNNFFNKDFTYGLTRSIDYYILTGALMRIKGFGKENHVMMVHNDTKKALHKEIQGVINTYINIYIIPLILGKGRKSDKFLDYIYKLYEEEYAENAEKIIDIYRKDLTRFSNDNYNIDIEKEINKLKINKKITKAILKKNMEEFITEIIEQSKCNGNNGDTCYVINSDNDHSNLELDKDNGFKGIIIGGFAISRALTIKGLRTSFFTRMTSAGDIYMQNMRWAGYHSNRDMIRLFITEETKKDFESAVSYIFETEHKFKSMCNKTNLKEFSMCIDKQRNLPPTNRRQNRLEREKSLNNSIKENARFPINKDNFEQQKNAVKNLLINVKKDFNNQLIVKDHTYICRNLPKELFINFITEYYFFEDGIRHSSKKDIDDFKNVLLNSHRDKWDGFTLVIKSISESPRNTSKQEQQIIPGITVIAANQKLVKKGGHLTPKSTRTYSNNDIYSFCTQAETYAVNMLYISYVDNIESNPLTEKDKITLIDRYIEEFNNVYSNEDKAGLIDKSNNAKNEAKSRAKEIHKKGNAEIKTEPPAEYLRYINRNQIKLLIKVFDAKLTDPEITGDLGQELMFGTFIVPPFFENMETSYEYVTKYN